jgi:predicted phage terminase large subunit-like protein
VTEAEARAAKLELVALLEEKNRRRERELARTDLYWLLTDLLGREDMKRPWLEARCREVLEARDGYLDLWAREHYKSTIITFGLTILEILGSHGADPLPIYGGRELCFGIFSHTRPIAKGFLRQIKGEFERNDRLKALFPDVLYANPWKEAPKWSEDDGIVVKRRSNPKESTVEGHGLVDGQPTGKHFTRRLYDDIVTRESVTTPEMIAKTTAALELSYNLGAEGGSARFIGTRYHYNDSYRTVMDRGTAVPRVYAATEDGTPAGPSVLMDQVTLAQKRRDMGPYTFACQMLQDPKADETQGFRDAWLRYYDGDASRGTNRYLLVDAANGKRPSNDYTSMWIVGLGGDGNYYCLDMVRDRLNLTERAKRVMELHRKWRPEQVRYERYGMMADIDHIRTVQEAQNYRFDIYEVAGQSSKADRIKRLIPLFEQGRVYLPRTMHRTNYEGTTLDLVSAFVEEEYKAFPVSLHDDMLDALARIAEPEMPLLWPDEGAKPPALEFTTQFTPGGLGRRANILEG